MNKDVNVFANMAREGDKIYTVSPSFLDPYVRPIV